MQFLNNPKLLILRRAIRQQMVLSFTYRGAAHVVEPYGVGLGRGRLLLRAFEQSVPGKTKGGWKLFEVDILACVKATGDCCIRERADFPVNDPAMNRTLATRRAVSGRLRFDVPALVRKQRHHSPEVTPIRGVTGWGEAMTHLALGPRVGLMSAQ